jgi:hypothetical protein
MTVPLHGRFAEIEVRDLFHQGVGNRQMLI